MSALAEQHLAQDLVQAILDCWPACNYAKKLKHRTITQCEYEALIKLWNKMPDQMKLECGYDEGDWE